MESNWKVTPAGAEFEIVIPPDATAIIELPAGKGGVLTESGRAISDSPGITSLPPQPGVHRLQAGSGHYHFITRNER
jgi:hypothetical protein